MRNTIERLIYNKMESKDFGESMCNETKLKVLRWVIQQLKQHGVMQAEASASAEGAAVGQRSVGTNAEAGAMTHGICKERNCDEPATKDYNGHEHWVCDYHYDKLNDEFDEEYR